MQVKEELIKILQKILRIPESSFTNTDQLRLLGTVPELDSMSVIEVLTEIEERFDITLNDDDISGEIFSTFNSLQSFVENQKTGNGYTP